MCVGFGFGLRGAFQFIGDQQIYLLGVFTAGFGSAAGSRVGKEVHVARSKISAILAPI
jgi:hypothetical protein